MKEEETKYTVDYFIQKFSVIPEELGVGELQKGEKKCAMGFCGGYIERSVESYALALILKPLTQKRGSRINPNSYVWDINDGHNTNYPQPTPKQRILAALRDIKQKTEAEQPAPPQKEQKPIAELPAKEMTYTFLTSEKIEYKNYQN